MPFPTLLRTGFVNTKNMPAAEKKSAESLTAIDFIINRISDKMRRKATSIEDRILILKASTGSGKSTVLIQHLYKHFKASKKERVAVTQPRVITAVDIAMSLPDYEPELRLDVNIGYTTGSFKRLPRERGIVYMTIDSLVQQFAMRGNIYVLNKYDFIVIDEVHERSLSTDNCLYRIKKLLTEYYSNDQCPFIILASATFDERIFMRYFEISRKNYIEVEGFTYEKTKIWPKYSLSNYQNYLAFQAFNIHITNTADFDSKMRDILIFLSSGTEIADMVKQFHEFNSMIDAGTVDPNYINEIIDKSYFKGGGSKNYLCPISLTRSSYQEGGSTYHTIFSKVSTLRVPIYKNGEIAKYVTPSRKVFIATNIAETGITIDTLKYCLDSGFYTSVEFNPVFGCNLIINKPVTLGMAIQRMGRVGRKAPGSWYPAYTQKVQDHMQKEQFSEVTFADITMNLLSLITTEQEVVEMIVPRESDETYKKRVIQEHGYFTLTYNKKFHLKAMDLIEMPSAEMITYALEKLCVLGFIDLNMRPTLFGFYAQKLRFINLESSRMIFAGYAHGVSVKWLITIAAILYTSPGGLYTRRAKFLNYLSVSDDNFEMMHNLFIADDFILQLCTFEYVLNVLLGKMTKAYNSNKNPNFDLSKWCEENSIDYNAIIAASQFRDELIYNFIDNDLNPYAFHDESLIDIFKRNFDEGMHHVHKIKRCIFEGFRLNLAVWTEGISAYTINKKGIPVIITSPYTQKNFNMAQPNYIVLSDYSLQSTMKGSLKIQAKNMVSVLDGHLNVDLSF